MRHAVGSRVAGLALIVLVSAPLVAEAHGIGLGLLELQELGPGRFAVLWKTNRPQDEVAPVFPDPCRVLGPAEDLAARGPHRFALDCGAAGVAGRELTFATGSGRTADVLVKVSWVNGGVFSQMSRLGAPVRVELDPVPATAATLGRYLAIGVEHILGGVDHLLFVLGLLLLAAGWQRLLQAITAFTVAHSLTLLVAALDVVRVPAPPVEVVIALSIIYLASEAARSRSSSQGRRLTVAALAFGLLHGLGFAGALADIGVPRGQLLVALLGFNLGVEVGQLIFVAAVGLPLVALLRWRPVWAGGLRWASAYGMGIVAVAWTLARMTAFWTT